MKLEPYFFTALVFLDIIILLAVLYCIKSVKKFHSESPQEFFKKFLQKEEMYKPNEARSILKNRKKN